MEAGVQISGWGCSSQVACHGTLKETGIHVLRIKMLIMSTMQTRMMKITMKRATGKHHGETETDYDNNEL